MKGVVFTEFLEMVEDRFSLTMVDEVIERAALSHGGQYTAVGTYPPEEMLALLSALAEISRSPAPALLHMFGEHLFGRFVVGYPAFFAGVTDALDFLEKVDSYIHVEVRKLYPDAELPRFDAERTSPKELKLTYQSPRRLSDLAFGLIVGCGKHFGAPLDVSREDLSGGSGEIVRFTITRP
ncbi:MAG: heme NO-binding domain-containing protein [Polyangiaceae bacterium]|jgi:hypothetical protein|nr:heme NO-binding domain-containing protein [Polyangiaceae bacterium]